MTEKFLLAVDESESSRRAVEYVARIFTGNPNNGEREFTLFHCVESVPDSLLAFGASPDTGQLMKDALAALAEQRAKRAEELLARYRDILTQAGIPAERIRIVLRTQEARPEARRVVAALAVLDEAHNGGYTTVVLGRRGASQLPESFLGSVADKVSRYLRGATVWIVD